MTTLRVREARRGGVSNAPAVASPAPALTRPPLKKATGRQLVFMIYAVVCSGAYGVEPMVSAVGPGLALIILLVLPFVYALPISLACAELTSRYPVEGGYYRWVRLAFGDLVGYTSGWLTWLATFATNASIAVLFSTYLLFFVPDLSPAARIAVSAGAVWFAVWVNYRGITVVGTASVIVTALVFVPFVLMAIMGLAQARYDPLQPVGRPDLSLTSAVYGGVLIAMWLYGGFEKMTVAADEIENPRRSFPIAVAIAVPLCALSYIVPTAAALAALGDWREWGEAYYMTAAAKIGGPWLGAAMAGGALVSNIGILIATMLPQSRLPMVLAEDGWFPQAFGVKHARFGTPVASLLVAGAVLTVLCAIPFTYLVGAAALVQSLSYLLIYAALLKLRQRHDAAPQTSFRIPLGTGGLALMAAPSVVIVAVVAWAGLFPDGSLHVPQAIAACALLASGPITYAIFRLSGSSLHA